MPSPDLTCSERLIIMSLRQTPGQTVDELLTSCGLKFRSNMNRNLRYLTTAKLISESDGRYYIAEVQS